MTPYVNPTQESVLAFDRRAVRGEILMLHLLRLREVADYSRVPELAPPAPISGAQAYQLYLEHTNAFLLSSGAEVLAYAEGGQFLIGPADERWDRALIVRQPSVEAFMRMAHNPNYLIGLGHRTAAIEDSRLLPLSPLAAKQQ